MAINRRDILKSAILLGAPILSASGPVPALSAAYKPLLLIFEGLDRQTSPRTVKAFLDPFVSRGIPVGIIVDLPWEERAEGPDAGLVETLALLAAGYPGLVEPVVRIPDLASQTPYFQMRHSSDGRNMLRALSRSIGKPDQWPGGWLTLATRQPAKGVPALGGVRAAGFRNVLFMPDTGRDAGYWETENGVLQLHGGVRLAPVAAMRSSLGIMSAAIASQEPVVTYASLAGISGRTDHEVASIAASLADAVGKEIRSGSVYATLPSEFHLRYVDRYERSVILRVDIESGDHGSRAVDGFIAALGQAGITFSLVEHGRSGARRPGPGGTADICVLVDADHEDWAPALFGETDNAAMAERVSCLVAGNEEFAIPTGLTRPGMTIVSQAHGARSGPTGLDGHGLFHVPTAFRFDARRPVRNADEARSDLIGAIGNTKDALVVVSSGALAAPRSRAAIVETIAGLAGNRGEVVSLGQFHRQAVVKDRTLDDLVRARQTNAEEATRAAEAGTHHRTELLESADLAWQYFRELTDEKSGLVPSTAWFEKTTLVSYRECTMWDVGSLINATISAHAIGLIDDDEFSMRTDALVASLQPVTIGSLRLPAAELSVAGSPRSPGDFNACDAGRLLIALRLLADYSGRESELAGLVSGMDFGKTIVDGRLHSIVRGNFRDIHSSSCTHYAARGYALWGLRAETPYDVHTARTDLDRQMGVLARAADIGPVGTEPHVLEELEFGYSPAARIIADVLYAAQLAEHRRSGKLVCVSEGPLRHEPWFSYQGYQIGGDGDPWKVSTLSRQRKYRTDEFYRSIRMLSTKAAFLWAAVRPGDYSHTLLKHVSRNGRIPGFGFVSGFYTASGSPTAGYSDVNTNGIILQSIAYILRGRKPQLETT